MREVHRELAELKGTVNPLDELGKRIARRYRLICFDEFHVADVTDAMILHRLLRSAVRQRRQLRHDLELPARRPVPERPAPRPHPAGDRAAERRSSRCSTSTTAPTTGGARWSRSSCTTRRSAPQADAAMTRGLRAPGRSATTKTRCCTSSTARSARGARAGGVVWFDFETLCGGPRSQNDYLEIATQFHTVLLSDVPQMPPRHGLARRAASPGWSTCCTTAASS